MRHLSLILALALCAYAADDAAALNAAGSAALSRGEYDAALTAYRQALQLDRSHHDSAGEILRLTNIGSVYFFRGQYLEAQTEYAIALSRVQQTGAPAGTLYRNLAALYEQLGELSEALPLYEQAHAISDAARIARRLPDPTRAIALYRAAHDLTGVGIVQAVDFHDLPAALASFTAAGDQLYRGEALYRMGRTSEAADAFRASGRSWQALFRLGLLSEALSALRPDAPHADFLPNPRDLYDAAIARELRGSPTPERLFALIDPVHDPAAGHPTLRAIQDRLQPGTLFLDYLNAVAVWATPSRSGIALTSAGIPFYRVRQLLIVPDGAPVAFDFLPVSYLPYAAFLLRDEPWRTPTLPWQRRSAQFSAATPKTAVYDAARDTVPFLRFTAPAFADRAEPNRSRISLAPSNALFRGEIQNLPLAKADVVSLALCAPASADPLARAFLAAGARSAVSTLRPVPAADAARFLARFDDFLAHGEPKARALFDARHSLPPSPSWNAFILMGDGQQPARPPLSWWWIAAVPAFAAIVLVLVRRR